MVKKNLLLYFMFQSILNILRASIEINYFHGWGVPPPIRGKFREND